ncbi:hypothetical protein BDR26DRAFT_914338 [Obelidium mucronatum]|nr:hypothetical protein BDR26DRAFT_914338 [Obelidium mucronatum]
MSARIERLEVAGVGKNLRTADNSIIAYAGWGVASTLEAVVLLKLVKPIKAAKITVELNGFTATKWTYGGKLITDAKELKEKPTKYVKQFIQLKEDVKEFKDPIVPEAKALKFPFELKLPANGLFPSFESPSGSIRYLLKVSLSWQESLNLTRTSQDVEVPVLFYIPNNGGNKLLKSPTVFKHEVPPSQEKCGCAINVPSRAFRAGDTVLADLTIYSTPANARLRMLLVSIKSEATYFGPGRESTVKFPRPLAEFTETFSKVQLFHGGEPLTRRLSLLIDESLAQPSLDSPLLSIKTRLQVQIVCDNSEQPNITFQVPLIIVPPISSEDAQVMPDPSDLYNERIRSVPSTPTMQPSPALSTSSQFTFPRENYSLPQSFSLEQAPPAVRTTPSTSSMRLDRSASISSNNNNNLTGPGPASNHISAKFNHFQFMNESESASANNSPQMEYYSPSPSASPVVSRQRLPRKSIPDLLEAPSANHISAKLGYLQLSNPPPQYGLGVMSNPHQSYPQQQPQGDPISPSGFGMGPSGSGGGVQMTPSRSSRSNASASAMATSSPKLGNIPEALSLEDLKAELPADPMDWDAESVALLVRATGAPDEIVERFLQENIDGVVFMSLTMDDLKNHLGIAMFSHRHRIMKVVNEYEDKARRGSVQN